MSEQKKRVENKFTDDENYIKLLRDQIFHQSKYIVEKEKFVEKTKWISSILSIVVLISSSLMVSSLTSGLDLKKVGDIFINNIDYIFFTLSSFALTMVTFNFIAFYKKEEKKNAIKTKERVLKFYMETIDNSFINPTNSPRKISK